jgi:aldose 1-epimerase
MLELVAGDNRAVVSPEHGGRIASLSFDGHEVLLEESEAAKRTGSDPPPATRWGMFLMAPWAGRVRHGQFSFDGRDYRLPINKAPHAIHGTIFDRPADSAEVDATGTEAICTWRLRDPWPFEGAVTSRVVLSSDAVTLRLEVEAEEAMPVTVGWHPWWRTELGTGGRLVIDGPLQSKYERDDESIPTGALVAPGTPPWDDCFLTPDRPLRLVWPGTLSLRLETDCPDVVVFDEIEFAHCVEPQSGPPDALNSGIHLQVLAAGQRATAMSRWVREA